jgi:mitochondrial fission protein ELM1
MGARDVCWVLTTGEAGMRSQALGLAEAVGLPIVEKRIVLRRPWSWLPGGLVPTPLAALHPSGDTLAPPWPRLLVACGRRSIGAALGVKRLSGGATVVAYVQNPELARAKFDLVAALPHDGVTGPNVVTVRTALHPVTAGKLAAARETWRERLAPGGARLIGVLVGGDNGGYRLTQPILADLVAALRSAHARDGFRAAITTSRRTGETATRALAKMLAGADWATLWSGEGENPYLGILALSERLLVTGESISMISEALATGSPVHVLPLEGQGRRHDAFLTRIVTEQLVSVMDDGKLDWSFTGRGPINATREPADRLRKMLLGHGDQVRAGFGRR